ncbi:MAG: hypothetical protein EOM68_24045, partial [Spirochaetia bacterium]|nr:hypothetical protein [Spirochaetia bacterium]
LVGVNSPSQDTLQANLKKLVQQKQQYPSLPVFVSMGESGRMSMVKLMDNPAPEMWELRRKAVLDIAAKFNFPAMMLNDMSDAGGLNVESEQKSILGENVERIRTDFEHDNLRKIMDCFPHITDWKLYVKREDDDKTLQELDVLLKQAQAMQILDNIGFEVEFRNKEIIISDTIVHDRKTQPTEFLLSKEANYGESSELRESLFSSEEEEKFLLQLFDKQFLSDNYPIIAPILNAEAKIRGLFKTLSEEQVSRLYDIIITQMSSPEGWSIVNVMQSIMQEFSLNEKEALTIARTECNRVATTTREVYATANDPPDAKYDWVGANDHRTTPICRAIKEQVKREGGGVSLERLKEIVRSVGTEYAVMHRQNPPPTDWTPHINCRHTFRRVWL